LGAAIPSLIAAFAVTSVGIVAALDSNNSFHRTGVGPDSPVGWVATFASVVLYGSFGILIKAPNVIAIAPSPWLFQMYVNLGVSTSLLLTTITLLGNKVFAHLTWWGCLGGLLYVLASIGATVGIRNLGYGVAVALWSGTTIVISFIWGTCFLGQELKSLAGSLAALLVLNAAIIGAGISSILQLRLSADLPGHDRSEVSFCQSTPIKELSGAPSMDEAVQTARAPRMARTKGFVAMLLGACINGSLTVPFELFARAARRNSVSSIEMTYLVSFVMGVLVSTLPLAILFWIGRNPMHAQTLVLPGFLTGLYWASGNVCAVYATMYLGNTVGYPLCQCQVVVTGLWSILYYKEIFVRQALCVFAASLVLILVGSAMLAVWAVA